MLNTERVQTDLNVQIKVSKKDTEKLIPLHSISFHRRQQFSVQLSYKMRVHF